METCTRQAHTALARGTYSAFALIHSSAAKTPVIAPTSKQSAHHATLPFALIHGSSLMFAEVLVRGWGPASWWSTCATPLSCGSGLLPSAEAPVAAAAGCTQARAHPAGVRCGGRYTQQLPRWVLQRKAAGQNHRTVVLHKLTISWPAPSHVKGLVTASTRPGDPVRVREELLGGCCANIRASRPQRAVLCGKRTDADPLEPILEPIADPLEPIGQAPPHPGPRPGPPPGPRPGSLPQWRSPSPSMVRRPNSSQHGSFPSTGRGHDCYQNCLYLSRSMDW